MWKVSCGSECRRVLGKLRAWLYDVAEVGDVDPNLEPTLRQGLLQLQFERFRAMSGDYASDSASHSQGQRDEGCEDGTHAVQRIVEVLGARRVDAEDALLAVVEPLFVSLARRGRIHTRRRAICLPRRLLLARRLRLARVQEQGALDGVVPSSEPRDGLGIGAWNRLGVHRDVGGGWDARPQLVELLEFFVLRCHAVGPSNVRNGEMSLKTKDCGRASWGITSRKSCDSKSVGSCRRRHGPASLRKARVLTSASPFLPRACPRPALVPRPWSPLPPRLAAASFPPATIPRQEVTAS
eukprot:SAG11_NODE_50_length_19992_cov_9.945157_23_plen_296_part_00